MFNASIVLYKQHPAEVAGLVGNLLAAPGVSHVYLVDNSPEQDGGWDKLGAEYLCNKGRNLGYGRAHNIALRRSLEQGVPYHLVVNPANCNTSASCCPRLPTCWCAVSCPPGGRSGAWSGSRCGHRATTM